MAACILYCVSWCCGSKSCVLSDLLLWQHLLFIVCVGTVEVLCFV